MSVEGTGERWVVPPTQALWLPPDHHNAVSLSGQGALRRLYLRSAPCRRMPSTVRVIMVSPLLKELLRRVMDAGSLDKRAGASVRTLERLFKDETGLSFGAWRQRARLLQSLVLLADGANVTQAAFAVGARPAVRSWRHSKQCLAPHLVDTAPLLA